MSIVCGTDLSANCAEAEAAAAAIAQRLGTDLQLVHVIDAGREVSSVTSWREPIADLLSARAKKIEHDFRIEAASVVLEGPTVERLLAFAREARARLLVLSATGANERFLMGRVTEGVVQHSTLPVLVVRDAGPIRSWLAGERPLRVMVGVDTGSASRAALRWAEELCSIDACDLQIVRVVWPAVEHARLGVPGPIWLDGMNPELKELLERDLRDWVGKVEGAFEVSLVVSPGWGRCDFHLASLAAQAGADLLVVGTQQKSWAARLWQGSVSRGVLHGAATNIACVSCTSADAQEASVVRFRRVLIATDFSEAANHALGAGYGLLQPGGEAHLVHVRVPDADQLPQHECETRLRALIPQGAAALSITTQVHVVGDHEAHTGIVRLSERLAVDAICMATHGRSGLSELILGSQAREVLRSASRPVLLVKAARA